MTLVGSPGVLAASRPATDHELQTLGWGEDGIALGSLAKRKLVLGWIGTMCDTTATLAVAEDRLVVSPQPREGCDSMALGRGVVLTFTSPVDAAAMDVLLEDTVLLPEPS